MTQTSTAAQIAQAIKTAQALSPTSPLQARQQRLIDNLRATEARQFAACPY